MSRIHLVTMAAAAAVALLGAGASRAEDGSQFVIRGDATKNILEQNEINIDTAMMKARTVLNTRQPSKATMNAVLQGRSSELRQFSFGNFANSGGLPIVINGNQFIGAIGVGGSAPKPPEWSDEICAWRALTKVMGPQPALLPDVQRTQ